MYFNGAAEWFFWLGVEDGLNASISDMDDGLDGILLMDTIVSRACGDSYRWGFCLGVALTPEEYAYLTSWPTADTIIPEPVIIDNVIITSPLEIDESNFPIIGRC